MSLVTPVVQGYEWFVSNQYRSSNSEKPFDFLTADITNSTGFDRTFLLVLKSCQFTNNFNVISEGVNDIFEFSVNGATYSNVIESGYYNIYTFIDVIQVALTNAFVGLIVEYDDVDQSLIFTVPAGCEFVLIKPAQSEKLNIPSDSFLTPNAVNRFLQICGLSEEGNIAYIGPTTFQGSSPVDLYGPRMIHINVGTTIGVLTPAYTRAQTIASVPVLATRGEVDYWQNNMTVGHRVNSQQLQNLRIFCYDQWECAISDAPPNTLFHLTFLLIPTS